MFSQSLLCVCSVLLFAVLPHKNLAGTVDEHNVVDSFVYGNKEYILINFGMRPQAANLYCSITFNARLARIKTEKLAIFLADALSETDHYLDNVWTSGYKRRNNIWLWRDKEIVDPDLLQKYYILRENEQEFNTTRECLAFRRDTQNLPKFLSLSCRLPRPAICERKKKHGNVNEVGSTHPEWFRIGDRAYKIYQDKVAYENASRNCIKHDSSARLAVLETTEDAEKLARYMIIGRPRIENAWIGARWSDAIYSYQFEEELSVLANETDESTGYPPWRNGAIQNKAGCVIIRRHSTGVHFIEAHCGRDRPYICYKSVKDNSEFAVVADNMKVFYRPRSWKEAKQYCESLPNSALPEPRTKEDMKKLLYVMGESDVPIDQIWLNGFYHDEEGWQWLSDHSSIPKNESYPAWLNNDTYTEEVEDENRCLNLDRENHNIGVFYGTDCYYAQRFICVFKGGKLHDSKKVLPQSPAEAVVAQYTTVEAVTAPETESIAMQTTTVQLVTEFSKEKATTEKLVEEASEESLATDKAAEEASKENLTTDKEVKEGATTEKSVEEPSKEGLTTDKAVEEPSKEHATTKKAEAQLPAETVVTTTLAAISATQIVTEPQTLKPTTLMEASPS